MGLTTEQLEQKYNWTKNYMQPKSNAADASTRDPNANVTMKNVLTMGVESHKAYDIQFNRYVISVILKEKYGHNIAAKYIEQLENHEIYCHDESHPYLPYCVAIDSMPFMFEGLKNLGCDTTTPQHLSSYAGGYYNLISMIASQFAGAVADVGMLKDFYYFAKKDFGEDFLNTHRDIVEDRLSQIIYSLNTPAGTRGFQAIFYNTSVFDEYYFKGLYETSVYPDGSKVIDSWEGINKLQKFFLTWFNKEREKALLTFPVITAALKLNDDNSIASDEWRDYVAKEFSEGNSFFVYMDKNVTSLSSCCRLRNDISEQLDNTFNYTLGGTGISTGSQNVLTINMNRLIQDKRSLEDQLDLMYKYQSAFAEWFHYLKDADMLPVYNANYISLEKQYLTIGVNGIVEAAEYLGMKTTYNPEYIEWLQKILGTMKEKNKIATKQYSTELGYKVMFNTEFVPAENLGAKFYQWDKKANYKVPETRNLYNSYFYAVEDPNTTILDKIKLHGKDTIHYLDGGSALHLNMEEHLTKEGWKKLMDVTAKAGTNYWTYNVRSTVCNECGYIGKKDLPYCIKCGSTDVDKATRVIGYLRLEKNFSKPRRIEASKRYKHKI